MFSGLCVSRRVGLAAGALAALALIPSQTLSTTRQIDLTLTEGTSMAAAVSPDRRWIAIDLIGALWVLPARGGEAKKITPDLLEARQPTWSADSRSIAFQGYDDGVWHIYVIPREGGEVKQLTDGTRIAFSSDRSGGIYTIWEASVNTGAVRQVSTRDGWMPSWSATGDQLTFLSRDEPQSTGIRHPSNGGLWTIDGEGQERLLQPFRPEEMPDAVGLSPNGIDLAYVTRGQLFLDGRPLTTDEDVFPFRPQWTTRSEFVYTADGQIKRRSITGVTTILAFQAKLSLQRSTYTIQHRELEPENPQPLAGIVAPVVSPDGRTIAFTAMGDRD